MSQQRKAMNAAAAASRKVISNSRNVAARLAALKAAAAEDEVWWTPALTFDWAGLRKGNNGTQWGSVTYTDEHGVAARLVVRINGERHSGHIMPLTEQGVAELTARVKNPAVKIQKRDKKPAVQIQKWSAQVKTAEDGITILKNAEGVDILPDDDKLSPYYQVASLVGEAFCAEAKLRVDRGLALGAKADELKRKDKAVAATAVLEAFNAGQGPRFPCDMVVSSEMMGQLRKQFPNPKDVDLLTKGAIFASSVKIASLAQEYISDRAPRNAGCLLPNPMTRISMNFDTTTGLPQLSFFDKGLPYTEEGRQKYEAAKVEGEPINADNVHKFITPRSVIDGIVNLDSFCFSSMGISMPVKAEAIVVEQPSSREVSIDDIYDDEFSEAPPAKLAGNSAPAKPSNNNNAKPEEDHTDLLSELGLQERE